MWTADKKHNSFGARSRFLALAVFCCVVWIGGCSSVASKNDGSNAVSDKIVLKEKSEELSTARSIEITPNSPADTVRTFYAKLREKKFREAIFLTNLRPAIEGLTDTELAEFSLDFEAIAGQVPAEVVINGEIISGDLATVTVDIPAAKDGDEDLQQLRLRRKGDYWVILTVEEELEDRIRKEGKQYLYNLRIETHHDEAKKMLERISKAQLAFSLQNGGFYTDLKGLIASGFVPEDIRDGESTGYSYTVNLSGDKRTYTANATPIKYGSSGKMSFLLRPDPKGVSVVTSRDTGGKPLLK